MEVQLMDWYRIQHTIGLILTPTGIGRAEYIKKHDIFYKMGNNCMVMFRKVPLYPKLISFGNNVWIASNVSFITHDVIHKMFNNAINDLNLQEHIGVISIKDNVFVGANTTILPNVIIGPDVVIGAGSLITKNIQSGGGYMQGYLLNISALLKNL